MTEFEEITKQIKDLTEDLNILKNYRQKICTHKNIRLHRGYTDYYGYDSEYIHGWASCDDCEIYASEKNREVYDMLAKTYEINRINKRYG